MKELQAVIAETLRVLGTCGFWGHVTRFGKHVTHLGGARVEFAHSPPLLPPSPESRMTTARWLFEVSGWRTIGRNGSNARPRYAASTGRSTSTAGGDPPSNPLSASLAANDLRRRLGGA